MMQPRFFAGGGNRNYAGQVRANTSNLSLTGFTELVERLLPIESATVVLSGEPTTTWPVGSGDAYHPHMFNLTTTRLREYNAPGQVHLWRIQGNYTGKVAGNTRELLCRMYNPDSGFQVFDTVVLSSGLTQGNFTFNFVTIADSASLDDGRGYRLAFTYSTTNALFMVNVTGITRISLAVEANPI